MWKSKFWRPRTPAPRFNPLVALTMAPHPILRTSAAHLDGLMTALEVNFVKLAECLVSPGWRLQIAATDAPAIHYNLNGMGRMIVGRDPPIALAPHTLAIVPAGMPFVLEAPATGGAHPSGTVESQWSDFAPNTLRRFVAGDEAPEIILICGYFRASYGAFIDLFATLSTPIVESFDATEHLDIKLKSALAELIAQEVGSRAMSTALLKQVLITVLRRSLISDDLWVERFATFSDPPIARAFSDMVTHPGAPHSVNSLAKIARLSRSAFIARFGEAFGNSPMTVLRRLRMRHAAILLKAGVLSIDQIANAAGYSSRGSFYRAFRQVYSGDPSDYRATAGELLAKH
jgi:AraC family transcriptional regulator, activator of mtrCDE